MDFDGWFFKRGGGEYTQNRWILMDDFSEGGVHKTDGFWWVIFQKGGGGEKYTQNRWILMGFGICFTASRNWAPGAFIPAKYGIFFLWLIQFWQYFKKSDAHRLACLAWILTISSSGTEYGKSRKYSWFMRSNAVARFAPSLVTINFKTT